MTKKKVAKRSKPKAKKVFVQEAIRFDTVEEARILKGLTTILNPADMQINEQDLINEKFGVMDSSNVCMIVPLTEEAKRVMARFVDIDRWKEFKENDRSFFKAPELDFNVKEAEIESRYSIPYLQMFMKLLTIINESVIIRMKTDYPMELQNDHFRIVLAPRVENN